MARAPRTPRIHGCNVLADGVGGTTLWSFTGSEARPAGRVEVPADQPLPAKVAGKGWRELFQPRVNLVWLPEQSVFLQLVHLPTDDPSEVPAMLEHQIEKLSPLPIGQIVWSYEVLKTRPTGGLPVLVQVAERSGVDAALGALEKRGFYADRVELALVQWVAGTPMERDGVYFFPVTKGVRRTCLVGWVVEGGLRSLSLVNLTEDDRWLRQLVDEVGRLAWVGEMEGWLPASFEGHLVTDEATASAWREPLARELGIPVDVVLKPADDTLAASVARRTVASEPRANLLPAEHAMRYRQQFTDRLWMGGLGALLGAYLVGVLIYLGTVEVQKYRHARASEQFAEVNTAYTNTLRLKAQAQVLQETVNLRYAALDCYLATVEAMPEELTLETFSFSGGQLLAIGGVAPADQEPRITEFWQSLKRKVVNNTNLFSEVLLKGTSSQVLQGVPSIRWSLTCTIRKNQL
jgi:hypothetical protein